MNLARLLVPGLVIAVMCGCSAPSSSTMPDNKAGEMKKVEKKTSFKVAMIAKSTTNPVFLSAWEGAKAAAAELKTEEGAEVVIEWLTPAKEDGTEQAQKITQAVNDGCDAVLISCSDASKVTATINDTVGRGIPVMTFDSDAADSKRFAYYGAADSEVGALVMDELAKQIGEKGQVAILAGNQNAPNLQARANGVKDAAKKYPGITIVDTFYHAETPQDATAKVQEVMQAHPEITGWAMVGGWPLFARSLLDLDPNKVKIVAVDCLPAQLDYIDKGVAPVLLAQPTFEWGHTSVKLLFKKVVKGEDVPAMNKMDLVRVDKSNLKEWAKKLKDWGFEGVDPKYLQ